MSFMNRLKSLASAAAATLAAAFSAFKADPEAFKPAEFTQAYMKPLKPGAAPQVYRHGTPQKRDRTPNSNRENRAKFGLPHGYPGAKLARKALLGTVGNNGMVS